jgi:hypothetical protein
MQRPISSHPAPLATSLTRFLQRAFAFRRGYGVHSLSNHQDTILRALQQYFRIVRSQEVLGASE